MREDFTRQEKEAIKTYKSGECSVGGVADRLGTTRYFAEKMLRRAGVAIRGPFEESLARRAREGCSTDTTLTKADIEAIVEAYRAGDVPSQKEAASRLGIKQQSFRRYLLSREVPIRSRNEVLRLEAEKKARRAPKKATPEATTKKITRSEYEEMGMVFPFDELKEMNPDVYVEDDSA